MQPDLVRLLPDTAAISSKGILHISGHSIKNLAETYGTPLYVFVCMETKVWFF